MSDDPLIAQIRGGDADALAEFVNLRRPQLLAYIERQLSTALRRKVEPEDLLQEAAADAVRSLPSMDLSNRDPFGWICQIAERRIIDAHRRFFGAQKRAAAREVPISGAADDSRSPNLINLLVASMTTASQAFSRDQRQERLMEALAQLPEEQREALRMRYVEGLPSKQIAEALGKSDGAVRVMLTRSLNRLQQLLGPEAAP
jgi:RNA polymerase sigma-70 factor (ECF subfamily)